MTNDEFTQHCIHETLSGVREGLSRFSGPSRVAVIYALKPGDPLSIIDPQNLLRGYESRLRSMYKGVKPWFCEGKECKTGKLYENIQPQNDPQLDGIICEGGSSATFFYQMWFTDHHPNLCSLLPTEYWLRHAILRLSHDLQNDHALYTGISGKFLREYASHAIRECLADVALDVFGLDLSPYISPILETILGISRTNEEGHRPFGILTFINPREMNRVRFLARFAGPDLPRLGNYKHVRKLLQSVEKSGNSLISDGTKILGVAHPPSDCFALSAEYLGRQGFLSMAGELICSFRDGRYSSNTFKAKLFEVEEALLDFNFSADQNHDIFCVVASLVREAESCGFGCSIVVDLAPEPESLAGQSLETPIDLRDPENLALAMALAKVDGALHIKADLKLYSFACLLDGFRVPEEDRARGARYNSALRFTAQHPESIIIVVSSDTAVSVFQQGRVLHKIPASEPYADCWISPMPLSSWLKNE